MHSMFERYAMKPQRAGPADSAESGRPLKSRQTDTGAPRGTGLFLLATTDANADVDDDADQIPPAHLPHGPPAGRDTKQALPVTCH